MPQDLSAAAKWPGAKGAGPGSYLGSWRRRRPGEAIAFPRPQTSCDAPKQISPESPHFPFLMGLSKVTASTVKDKAERRAFDSSLFKPSSVMSQSECPKINLFNDPDFVVFVSRVTISYFPRRAKNRKMLSCNIQ